MPDTTSARPSHLHVVCTPPMSRAALDELLAAPQGHTVSGKRMLALSGEARPVLGQDQHGRYFATFLAIVEAS